MKNEDQDEDTDDDDESGFDFGSNDGNIIFSKKKNYSLKYKKLFLILDDSEEIEQVSKKAKK